MVLLPPKVNVPTLLGRGVPSTHLSPPPTHLSALASDPAPLACKAVACKEAAQAGSSAAYTTAELLPLTAQHYAGQHRKVAFGTMAEPASREAPPMLPTPLTSRVSGG